MRLTNTSDSNTIIEVGSTCVEEPEADPKIQSDPKATSSAIVNNLGSNTGSKPNNLSSQFKF